MVRGIGAALAAVGIIALAVAFGVWRGLFGEPVPRGEVAQSAVPADQVAARTAAHKQILFGDLHVHTAFSADAFALSLPILNGEGLHPPADACDFARFCSGLDFWAITDHAEQITERNWQETKDLVRECNAIAGDPENPDVVALLGWEWTHVGATPDEHYGHKNVILRETHDEGVPARPINAGALALRTFRARPPFMSRLLLPYSDWSNRQLYFDQAWFQESVRGQDLCPEGVDVRDLPSDCLEVAETPAVLYEKLRQWGFETLVIPHGNTWGLYTPPGTTWDKQLRGNQHDPEQQALIEVYSGHGNSEEYRDWRHVALDADGNGVCPEPSGNFTACCWRAGEIIRARCGDVDAEECEGRVIEARQNFSDAGINGMITVPGTQVEDWLGCGVDPSLFIPTMDHRPGGSVQYALAISNFDDGAPRSFRFGFIGSSDSHTSRPGTGYKEVHRQGMADAAGARDEATYRVLNDRGEPSAESVPWDGSPVPFFNRLEAERQASFFTTGGLVAAHAAGRSRDAIWGALERKEVYATSGPRILLWFDLVNGPAGVTPMGSDVRLNATPRFRVRAAGALQQRPGCPDFAVGALGADEIERICRGECYNPTDTRHRIDRLEVVRIRPQARADEPVAELIEDPWRVLPCPANAASCAAEFTDDEFQTADREFVYYVRAVQQATPAINAANVRCTYDASGNCVEVSPCHGSYRTDYDDDCTSPAEERAWSSPIFVRPR